MIDTQANWGQEALGRHAIHPSSESWSRCVFTLLSRGLMWLHNGFIRLAYGGAAPCSCCGFIAPVG